MTLNRAFAVVLPLCFLFIHSANGDTLVTGPSSDYFDVDGGGGGLSSTLNNVSIEDYCVDFANWINFSSTYTVNVTPVTSSNLSETRFANVSSFTTTYTANATVSLDSTDANTLLSTDENVQARYEMAAYLITLYQIPANLNTPPSAYNDGIQQAIWDLLDPAGGTASPQAIGNPTWALEQAAEWYSNPESNKSFLANVVIISDPSMTTCTTQGGAKCGGFQEQLAILPTPEPRGTAILILGLFTIVGILARKIVQRRANAFV